MMSKSESNDASLLLLLSLGGTGAPGTAANGIWAGGLFLPLPLPRLPPRPRLGGLTLREKSGTSNSSPALLPLLGPALDEAAATLLSAV